MITESSPKLHSVMMRHRCASSLSGSPLHYAAACGRLRAVRILVAVEPASGALLDTHQLTPLHYAAQRWYGDIVAAIAHMYPPACVVTSSFRTVPLHLVMTSHASTVQSPYTKSISPPLPPAPCKRHSNVELIRLLVSIHPQSAMCRDDQGRTAFHLARCLPREVMRLLVAACPEGRSIPDSMGNTPGHDLVASNSSDDISMLQTYLEGWSDGAMIADRKGRKLYHCARSVEVMMFLRSLCPGVESMRDKEGMTPFIVAAEGDRVAAMEYILSYAPDSWKERDLSERSAFHHAARKGCTAACELLLRIAPESVHDRSALGSTPLHYAVEHLQNGVVSLIVSACPAAVRAVDKAGQLPVDLIPPRRSAAASSLRTLLVVE